MPEFTIHGCPVPKGNAAGNTAQGWAKRRRYRKWVDGAIKELKEILPGVGPFSSRVFVMVNWWTPDARKRDWDNAFKAIGDMLVEAGLLPDDSVKWLTWWTPAWMGIDRVDPRIWVTIWDDDRPMPPEWKRKRKK